MESSVIRPLANILCHPEFPVDDAAGSRYATLFERHGVEQFDNRRQSFLEYLGMGPNKVGLMTSLQDFLSLILNN